MTRSRLPAYAADALRFVGVAVAAALIVAIQAAFVGPVKPAWVEATPYGLPLAVCVAGFVLLFVTLVLLRTRTEIRRRRIRALVARERAAA